MQASTVALDHDAALAYLYGRINYERTPTASYRPNEFKLDRMRELLALLGDPHDGLKIVHVAGTKGKGSTATMIAAVLSAAGYRTGLYTSPHLERLEERMMIDGVVCSSEELVELVALIRPAADAMDAAGASAGSRRIGPTFFEITTAMAMLYFARRGVDAVVLEVGLGGRLDSTNVCQPLVSVITSISFDHMKQLGNTLVAIAGEKAGIIKPGIPVVTGVTQDEPLQVIERVARQQGCRLYRMGVDFDYSYEQPAAPDRGAAYEASSAVTRGIVHYRERDVEEVAALERRLESVSLGLLGRHQAANAAVALATLGLLQKMGWQISEDAIRRGLADVRCPARIEVVQQRPTVVLDVAHNVASIEALVQVLDENFVASRRVLLFASSKDKDARGMLRRLLPHFDQVVFTRFLNNPRSADPDELAQVARELAAEPDCRWPHGETNIIHVCPDPESAWRQMSSFINPEDLVCVTGSFFFAAEMRPLLQQPLIAAPAIETAGSAA
jgi:dihydrofolate synthase/folylpolyglutamate synthase